MLAGAAPSWSATPVRPTSRRLSAPRSSRCSRRSSRPRAGPRTGCRACCWATRTRPAAAAGPRVCPVPGHPCLDSVTAADVVARGRGARLSGRTERGARHEDPALARARCLETAFVQGRTTTWCRSCPDRGPDGRGRARTYDWPDAVREVTPGAAGRRAGRRGRAAAPARPGAGRALAAADRPRPGRVRRARLPARRRRRTPGTRWPTGPTSPLVHVTHFNALMWDCGRAPTDGDRARHRRPRPALDRRAGPARRGGQRAGPARPAGRRRPAAGVRRDRARSTCSA